MIRRILHGFLTAPEATPSISVTPAEIDPGSIQAPGRASEIFAIGIARHTG